MHFQHYPVSLLWLSFFSFLNKLWPCEHLGQKESVALSHKRDQISPAGAGNFNVTSSEKQGNPIILF